MANKREVEKYIKDARLPDLVSLKDQLDASIREKQEVEKRDFMAQMQQAAKDRGMNLDDFLGRTPQTRVAKYRNPNPKGKWDQTWSGRGRVPQWVKEAKDAGKLEQLRIKSEASEEDESEDADATA
jgi:DNA-binding protein H-NS